MSIAPKALRKMRIISIPLTRPKPNLNPTIAQNANRLTYYQFQISRPPPTRRTDEEKPIAEGGEKKGWWPEQGVVNWATEKAANTWTGFGKAKGGWKLKVYQGGEKLVDRLDFEELALKGIDPKLGPTITGKSSKLTEKEGDADPAVISIPLIYPPSLSSGSEALSELHALITHRIPKHRKGFYTWMVIAPFTAPFMIIPIIPNLPFFFCVWRSWSHYRAWRASQYVESLLNTGAIVPEASESLDKVYEQYPASSPEAKASPSVTSSDASSVINSTTDQAEPKHNILLSRDAVPAIVELFNLKPTTVSDLYRAVEQARVRVKSGRVEL
ncbi:mitochondrial K+-H+ exchange-related-domain-containing protein [Crucibulum laeve]|uniref:Mitochondrial K+-H+ exchange-related-domain-containing protein n=1 Tax=Crucibulum laeve TaxID=68775 RepID=A0A5C3LK66_9AGAR|nr:mitochondrial K+-H+ exchange-related-domain-containing protein [Crucibulum laeve]